MSSCGILERRFAFMFRPPCFWIFRGLIVPQCAWFAGNSQYIYIMYTLYTLIILSALSIRMEKGSSDKRVGEGRPFLPFAHCCALIYLPAWQLHHYISTISRRAPIFPAEPFCGVCDRIRQPSQRERLALCVVYSRSIGGEKGDPSGRPRRYASFTSLAFVVSEEMEQFLSSPPWW